MKSSIAVAGLLAALLLTPAAGAAKHAKKAKQAKTSPQADAMVQAGIEDLKAHNYAGAIGKFNKAVNRKGTSAAYFLLGYAHYQKGFASGDPAAADKDDATETISAYQMALALDPDLEEVAQPYKLYHSLALSYEALGDYDKAIEAYKKAFSAAPSNAMLPLYAARLRYRMGDVDKSASNLALSLKQARLSGQVGRLADAVRTNPLFSVMLESPAHQRVLSQYGVSAESPTAQAKRDAAEHNYGLRDSVRASAAVDPRASGSGPRQAVMDQLAAANEEFRFRRLREAINAYNDTLTLDRETAALTQSQTAFIYDRIGTCYNRLGQSAEAISVLRRSVQEAPVNTSAHYQLALAYSVSGRYQESLRALSEAFKTAPSSGELRKYMLLAKTDSELEPVRDLPGFRAILTDYKERLQARL